MNKNTLAALNAHLIYVPFSNIDLSDDRYRFRTFDGVATDELQASLKRSGQTHPALLEQLGPDSYLILDGHRRADAIRGIRDTGGTWEKILAHVVSSDQLSAQDRFHLLCERNLSGREQYGLIDRGRFFFCFVNQGLALRDMAEQCEISALDAEDMLELAGVSNELADLLNTAPLKPSFALMLVRRYQGWSQGAFAKQAPRVARQLIHHARTEKITMKTWRFLLDFYWPSERPFLARLP